MLASDSTATLKLLDGSSGSISRSTPSPPPVLRKALRASFALHVEDPSLAQVVLELERIGERVIASVSMSIELGEELVKLEVIARTLEQIASRY